MNDRRSSEPIFYSTSLNASSRRASGSSQESGKRSQDSSSQNSWRRSAYEDRGKKQQPLVASRPPKGQEPLAYNAEEHILALEYQLKVVNDARVAAIQEAIKASEELKLYKIQLHKAHQEIRRAQEIIDKVDKERYDAEKAAAEARTLARRYQRDLLLIEAIQEGRKMGMQEGIEHGRSLALLGSDEYEDMDEGSARCDLEYADVESRSDLGLAFNEEIAVLPPQHSNIELAPQAPPQPIPVPPPEPVQHIPPTRPQSFRSPSPSLIYQTVSIPPDGYIPTIDPDNVIRIPPPHELARPPPTPERLASPQLPEVSQEEPRPSSRSHKHRQTNPSIASASTFPNAAGPSGRVTTLSAIPEAQSPYASAVPADGNVLRRQPSQISSYQSNNVNPGQGRGAGLRPAQSTSINRRSSISSNVSASQIHRKSAASIFPSRPPSGIFLSQPGLSSLEAVEISYRTPEALPVSMPCTYQVPTEQDVASAGPVDMSTASQVQRHQLSLDSSTAPPVVDHSMTGWEDVVRTAGSHIPVSYDHPTSGPGSRNIDRSDQ